MFVLSDTGRLNYFRIRLGKRRTEGPIVEISEMPLENRVDEQFVAIVRRQQAVRGLVRPVDRQRLRERHEPVIKHIVLVRHHETVPHSWPGEIIDPGRMSCEQLRWSGGQPIWHSIVVLRRGVDLPPHQEEHGI